ncbi:GntR family transcriptional regulator [Marinimicrococcus flavescens]|uniref:GntR family transcriptional regulator n=1 Tax=Marinimicrococcus flavescens TaxID=3031815 RepID=A0AAP3UXY0_9PROT|nr:GntR family transcriptional regulator [Marinimicrococcus flavescens]
MSKARIRADGAEQEMEGQGGDALLTSLRHDIVFGAVAPGQWLRQSELERRYGTSRAAIRRALAELESQGLVEHRLNYGYRVAVVDAAERAQLCQVRVILETGALPMILERLSADDLVGLRGLASAFEQAVEHEGRPQQVACNFAFHRRFYELSGNGPLEALIRHQRERADQGSTGRWQTVSGLRGASEEHFAILDALEARDLERLTELVRVHIERF